MGERVGRRYHGGEADAAMHERRGRALRTDRSAAVRLIIRD